MKPAIMLITVLGGPMDSSQSYLLYGNISECEMATTIVSETLSYDHTIQCVDGDRVSSPRPKRNPIYGE